MSGAVPALRFPEFSGTWKSQALGRHIVEYGEKSLEQDQYEVLTSARAGLVRQREYFDNDRIAERDNAGFNVIPAGYLTYRSRSDNRRFYFNENKLEITGIISVYYPVFEIAGGSNKFFVELFERYVHEIGKYAVGTSQTVLSMNQLRKIELPLPTLPEQQKIAAFLGAVDGRLAGLRRVEAELMRFKAGLMQRLFSQELRFTQDDGSAFPDWEEKRLGEVAEIVGGGTPESVKPSYWGGSIPWFTPSEIKAKYLDDSVRHITENGLKNSSAKMLPVGALVLSTRATVGEVGIAGRPCATNQGFQSLIVKPCQYNEFWYYWIQANKKAFLTRAAGSTFLEIGKSEVAKIEVEVPIQNEQRKIADALTSLDAKITATAAQITKTERFKQGLLQQMFV